MADDENTVTKAPEEDAATGPVLSEVMEAHGNGGVQEQLRRIARAIDRQGRKIDHLSDEQEALRERAGRMSARSIITLISILSVAAGILISAGTIFVQNSDNNLKERIEENTAATTKLIAAVQTIIDRNSAFIDGLNASRWTNQDHAAYHDREIVPVANAARSNQIAIARIEQQLKELSRKMDGSPRHGYPFTDPKPPPEK